MFHFTYHFTNTMIYTLFGIVRWICKSDHKTFFSALLDLSEILNFKMCMCRVQKTFLFVNCINSLDPELPNNQNCYLPFTR